jgi:hypothetical protein
MSFLGRIFRSNLVECPRCLGKGNVDMEDIKRLRKELFWAPGKCAYCNRLGKVPADRIEKLDADVEYLTADLSSWERHKVIAGDEDAMKRARVFKKTVLAIVEEIEHLYYIENKEPGEIAEHIFHKNSRFVYSASEKQEMVEYVEKVISSKLKK